MPNKLIKSDKSGDTKNDVLADEPHSDKVEKKEAAQVKSKQPVSKPIMKQESSCSSCHRNATFAFSLIMLRMMFS